MVFALVQKNEILSLIAIFIGGLLIATETFLLYLASIFRSKENGLGALMKHYNAHVNLQLSQPTPAEKLRKIEKNKRRILTTQSETSREAVLSNAKSKESFDVVPAPVSAPIVHASAPASMSVPPEFDKISSKKSKKMSEEVSGDFAPESSGTYPDASPDVSPDVPTGIIDFDVVNSQLSTYISHWTHTHPELIRISETKVSTNEGTYIFDELLGDSLREGVMFGLNFDYVLPYQIAPREFQVQELKDTLAQITKI